MKQFSYFITTLLLVSGCTTVEFVRKDLSPNKHAVVRYSLPSDSNREAKYRAELEKQATNFCGGAFQVTKEYEAREQTGSSAGLGTGFGIGRSSSIFIGGSDRATAMYRFVEFDCK